MDREEKLMFLYFGTLLAYLLCYACGASERMARDGFLPHRLEGDTTTYWYKPAQRPVPVF